jgi:hypothetical protein
MIFSIQRDILRIQEHWLLSLEEKMVEMSAFAIT